MSTPLPAFIQVTMPISFRKQDGKTVVPEWQWDFDLLLMSAPFWYDKVMYTKGCKLMVDSAGFQYGGKQKIHKRNEFFANRERFYRWQCEYGDYIIAGDIPISLTRDFAFIKDCLLLTMDNMDLQCKLGAEDRLVNVVHGHSPDIIRYWHKGVGAYPSIGWAFGSSVKTAVYGFALQLLTLKELGEFKKKVKVIHCLGAVSKNVAIGMHYLVDKLGIETEMLSFDASSSSAERFGNFVMPDGEIVSFSEVREGRKIALFDGTILDDVPTTLRGKMKHDISRTNMTNSATAWKNNVVRLCAEKGEEYDIVAEQSGAKFMWDVWKSAGSDVLVKELDRKGALNKARVIEHTDQFRIL